MRACLRGVVMTCARTLEVDPERASDSYRARWEATGYWR